MVTPTSTAGRGIRPEGPAAGDGRGFLAGGGELGALMRAHDWAATPLGEAAGWPAPLRTLVRLMLASRQPMFMAWGPERTMLYNDRYAWILGAKHPRALGRPFAEVWADILADVGPIMDRAYAGVATHMDDIRFTTLNRHGYPEEAHFSFSYTPVHDEATGAVAGMFCACEEITGRVFAERRAAFRLELGERLRSLSDPRAVAAAAAAMVGEQLGGARVGYAEVDAAGRAVALAGERRWLDDGIGPDLAGALAACGDPVPRALAAATVARDGRLAALLFAAHPEPRRWAEHELALLREAAERTWSSVKRAKAEAALAESEARFRHLADSAPVMVWVTDAGGGCTYLSRSWYAFTGQTEKTGLGLGWLEATHPEDRAEAERVFLAANAERRPFRLEYRLRRADGAYHWAIDAAAPRFGASGEFLGFVGSVVDITERKEAEEALRRFNDTLEAEAEARTRERDRVWRNSRDLLVVVGADGILRAVNPAWTAILGHDPAEAVGRSFLDFVHPDDVAMSQDGLRTATRDVLTNFENRWLHRDGSPRWISWMTSHEGDLVFGYGRHVTAEKEQAEALRAAEGQLRQAQKMEAIGQLTGGIAHDFNNLLQAMSSCLQLVERRAGPAAEDLRPLVEAGRQAVGRGAKLVQQLMAFARRQALRPEAVDVRERVLGMSELLARALRGDIALETAFAPGAWPVLVDPTQFELALLNLAVNARDAMPGGGRLRVAVDNLTGGGSEGGDAVRVVVTDTGAGMAPGTLARAFEPFFTTKGVGEGSGLGLAQVYGFAKQSGGTVALDSAPGQGTTVTLVLPRAAGAPARDAAGQPAPRDGGDASGAAVLLVEDDPVVAGVVAAVLADLGCEVRRAASADEALPILRGPDRIDLLFSDVVMPGALNGVELAREARRVRPGLPVLLTTGYSEDVARGAVGLRVLPKPYPTAALVEAVEAALAERPAASAA